MGIQSEQHSDDRLIICKEADSVNVISEKYTSFCKQKRNEYMVDHFDFVIIVWNEERQGGMYVHSNTHKEIKIL